MNFQESDLFTGLAAGEYTITVKDARGCTFAQKFNVTNTGGPTAVTATTQAASCQNNDGSITVGTATGVLELIPTQLTVPTSRSRKTLQDWPPGTIS
ncbi:hypothetical protein [Pontibacter sp. BAB1700]|uniref:hypothetical protein n=1 Tax=Pontibacter sp. BAB1700 TaxID=1144253 RepID=UPI00026BC99B|nr:hypothetical protein [Pontibacter sp. BAB1700]EJF10175.1 hypothetical protein O71_10624 [Pontibacter sp. BAB1700]